MWSIWFLNTFIRLSDYFFDSSDSSHADPHTSHTSPSLSRADERIAAEDPGALDYALRYPGAILVFVIGLTYAVIAPLILPFAVAFFGVGLAVMKYQVRDARGERGAESYLTSRVEK